MIIALAGRRIDAPGTEAPRFPLENASFVRQRIHEVFTELRAQVLVSSAACGADLLAIDEADRLGIRYRIILPFDSNRFRETSVTDRPGEWGSLYDRVLKRAGERGDIVEVSSESDGTEGYAAANLAIIEDALNFGRHEQQDIRAVLVWDGKSRGGDDLTKQFAKEAREKGIPVIEIKTL